MDINVSYRNKWTLVHFEGRLDSFTSQAFAHKVKILLKMGKKHLAFDLSKCECINLASLRFLRSIHIQLKNQEGKLALLYPNDSIKKNILLFSTLKESLTSVELGQSNETEL